MRTIIAALCCLIMVFAFAKDGMYRKPLINFVEKKVVATIYKPSMGPLTADGTRINSKNASGLKLIAVSWDLRKEFPFGTKVLITGAGNLDGIYTVRDLMNKRWTKKIDILVAPNHKLVKYGDVKLTKLPPGMEDAYVAAYKELQKSKRA
jgi:3D (Asp-Asp-Asp) domain-containing protein